MNTDRNKYSELLEDRLIIPTDRIMELNRIDTVWNKFLEGEQKTVGVENIFPISLDVKKDKKKQESFIGIKTLFKNLNDYSSEGFRNSYSKDKIRSAMKYSNEPSTLRLFSILELISLLGGHKPDTWVSRKEIAISGHMSPTSVNTFCESLYNEKFVEKYQDFKKGKTKGSICYKLNKRAKETLGRTDSVCKKIDKEVWNDFKIFLNKRADYLRKEGYVDTVVQKIDYGQGDILEQEIVYSDKKIEGSNSFISILDKKVLKLENTQ